MTDLQIFNNDRFGQVRIIPVDGELMFVAKDVCDCLEITKHRDAISRLDSDERGSVKLDTPGGKQDIAAINEYGLYSMVLSSRKPEAKEFKRWITHDVIPAIRKTGSYSMVIPQTLPEALRAYADEVESHNVTKAIVAQQEQQIAEFKPVKDYVDKILSSKSCLRKVGDQWILYKQHMAKGFTKSETFTFCRSDGRLDSKITTKWTQKGRLEIHSILTKLNIHAVCEDVA